MKKRESMINPGSERLLFTQLTLEIPVGIFILARVFPLISNDSTKWESYFNWGFVLFCWTQCFLITVIIYRKAQRHEL